MTDTAVHSMCHSIPGGDPVWVVSEKRGGGAGISGRGKSYGEAMASFAALMTWRDAGGTLNGPWSIGQTIHNDGSVSVVDADGNLVCVVAARTSPARGKGWQHSDPERDAMAQLIAAIPDMLGHFKNDAL